MLWNDDDMDYLAARVHVVRDDGLDDELAVLLRPLQVARPAEAHVGRDGLASDVVVVLLQVVLHLVPPTVPSAQVCAVEDVEQLAEMGDELAVLPQLQPLHHHRMLALAPHQTLHHVAVTHAHVPSILRPFLAQAFFVDLLPTQQQVSVVFFAENFLIDRTRKQQLSF